MTTIIDEIKSELFQLQDESYRDFQSKLLPTIDPDTIIGVRTPPLRQYAKQLIKREHLTAFLNDLPHQYFDENQLHAFILSEIKDYGDCMEAVNRFLPFVNNWATCEQMSPRVFKKHKQELLTEIKKWIASDQTYTVRFAIGMLMEHFLDDDFDSSFPRMVASVRSEEYYINMMIAWYFSTALAKQYEAVLPFMEEKRLESWTHNKAIQKAIESNRITLERKDYLRGLKIYTK